MEQIALFNNIPSDQLNQLLACFQPVVKDFQTGETIMQNSFNNKKIGILLSGNAHMYSFDEEGVSAVLEHYTVNSVFGEYFMSPIESLEYLIEADSNCTVLFMDYQHMIHPCQKACEHHSQLIGNMIQMTAQKVRLLTLRINFLSQKTVRQKLLAYLEHQSLLQQSKTFTIPISLVELAEYLCVDRSAVMKELHHLRNEKQILSKGRKFTLLV